LKFQKISLFKNVNLKRGAFAPLFFSLKKGDYFASSQALHFGSLNTPHFECASNGVNPMLGTLIIKKE